MGKLQQFKKINKSIGKLWDDPVEAMLPQHTNPNNILLQQKFLQSQAAKDLIRNKEKHKDLDMLMKALVSGTAAAGAYEYAGGDDE